MTKIILLAALAFAALAAPAFAGRRRPKGEADFKKCKACHSIIAADGTEISEGRQDRPEPLRRDRPRRSARTPISNTASSIIAVGADGAVWDEASLAAYVADPTAWLKDEDRRCRRQVEDVLQAGQGRRGHGGLSRLGRRQ